MSISYTSSESYSFTVTHARHLASKVAADLKRIQRLYPGGPSDTAIELFEEELIELLKGGYLEEVTYGFIRDGCFIEPTIKYTASELNNELYEDSDPGKIRPGKNISGAFFTSFLSYSRSFFSLSVEDQESIKSTFRLDRSAGTQPDVSGTYQGDHNYVSGGRMLSRLSLKS